MPHPVGRAIVEGARTRGLVIPPVDDADLSIAHGVSGHLGGALIRVGSHHFIAEDCGIECGGSAREAARMRRGRHERGPCLKGPDAAGIDRSA